MMPPRKTIVNNEELDVLNASFTKYDSNNEETIDVGTTVNNDEDDWLATAFLEYDDHSNAKSTRKMNKDSPQKQSNAFNTNENTLKAVQRAKDVPEPLPLWYTQSFNIDWEVFDALIERERILGPLASNHPQMTIQAMSDQMDPSGRPILTLPQRGDIALSVVHQMVQPVELGIGTHNPDYGSARSSNHYLQASVQVTSDVSGRAILPLPQRQPSVANQKTAPVGQRQNVGLHAVKKRSKSETSSDTVATSVQDASDLPGSSRYPLINSQPGRYPPPPQPRLWPAPRNSVPPPSRMSFRMLSRHLNYEEQRLGYCVSNFGDFEVINIDQPYAKSLLCKWGPQGGCGESHKVRDMRAHIKNAHGSGDRDITVCEWDGCQETLGAGKVMAHVSHAHFLKTASFCKWCRKLFPQEPGMKLAKEHRCTPGEFFTLPDPEYV